MNCLFKKIIDKEMQADIIYEDNGYIAFLDINPKSKGHFLVIPKKHSDNLIDINESTYKELMMVANETAKSQIKKLNATGYNLIVNVGEDAGQEVFHTHVHIIPAYKK